MSASASPIIGTPPVPYGTGTNKCVFVSNWRYKAGCHLDSQLRRAVCAAGGWKRKRLKVIMDKVTTETKHLYTNDYETFVATSLEDAYDTYCKLYGETPDDDQRGNWHEVPDGDDQRIWFDQGDVPDFIPTVAVIFKRDGQRVIYSAKASEWASVYSPGFLCSTEA